MPVATIARPPIETVLEQIDSIELSERAVRLREEFFRCQPGVAGERARLTVEAWKETEGEAIALRKAKLLKKVLEGVPVPIFRGQRIVGSMTKYFRGAYPFPDIDGLYLVDLLKERTGTMAMGGHVERGLVDEEDWAALTEAAAFWQGKTLTDAAKRVSRELMGDWYEELVDAGTPDYDRNSNFPPATWASAVVQKGLVALVLEAREHIRRFRESHDPNVEKLWFWEASIIALEATIAFARRYATTARQLAANEQDPKWRAELQRIAETCEWVPEHPARTFREALQSVVLVHLAEAIANPPAAMAGYGNMDQYLYPCFQRDRETGRLTLEEAADYVADFLLYAALLEWVKDAKWRDYLQRGQLTSLGLGGTDETGKDVTNELSYLFVHVMSLVRYAEPHLVIRWHKGIPSRFLRKAMECNQRVGGGVPQFQNGEHIVDLMVRTGIPREAAYVWTGSGCSQTDAGGNRGTLKPSYMNIPLLVDLVLHNGVASKTGKKLGLETGDPRSFDTFDKIWEAFEAQAEFVLRKQLWHDKLIDTLRPLYHRQVLVSALLPECMARGQDYDMGGLGDYRMWVKKDRGGIAAADSLTAIKKLVYDEKRVTMMELVEAVDGNFEGPHGEEVRRLCLAAPKYGNDSSEPDAMVRQLAKLTAGIILSEKSVFGTPYAINRNGQAWHYMAGKRLAALPSGRKAGEPLPDGSLSAMQGMDRNGPTALLNSGLNADFTDGIGGIMTIKLPAMLLHSGELQQKAIAMMEAYFQTGGTYLQFNILDTKALQEAQRHPENFRDLVVRVGGYSAYFVNLSPEVQDEIIRRTEHGL